MNIGLVQILTIAIGVLKTFAGRTATTLDDKALEFLTLLKDWPEGIAFFEGLFAGSEGTLPDGAMASQAVSPELRQQAEERLGGGITELLKYIKLVFEIYQFVRPMLPQNEQVD